ncbi:MAG: hypothetical protein JNK21_11990, partial [Rhodospirillaceae bacterium]|nr:hypothetical protein [Rhodospirillaceae bacterium]
MTRDTADEGFFGSCFVCGGAHTATNRRAVLRAVAAAPLAAAAMTAPSAHAKTGPRPPEGTFVIHAGWALTEAAGQRGLVRDAFIRV